MKQNKTLHYHDFCVGHGFLEEIAESERCDCCGDTSASYLFSFDNKEEFIDKFVYNEIEWLYQDDEWSLTKEEILKRVDCLDERIEYAQEIYADLIQR